jgi:hypothetical protein
MISHEVSHSGRRVSSLHRRHHHSGWIRRARSIRRVLPPGRILWTRMRLSVRRIRHPVCVVVRLVMLGRNAVVWIARSRMIRSPGGVWYCSHLRTRNWSPCRVHAGLPAVCGVPTGIATIPRGALTVTRSTATTPRLHRNLKW